MDTLQLYRDHVVKLSSPVALKRVCKHCGHESAAMRGRVSTRSFRVRCGATWCCTLIRGIGEPLSMKRSEE